MTSSDVYRLAVSTTYRVFTFGLMIVMSLVGIGLMVSAIIGNLEGPPFPAAAIWCAILAWNWHVLLGIPYEIRFESPDRISFVSLRRTVTLHASDIYSIRPYGAVGGFYILRHSSGKIRLLIQFTGFHEVIAKIKAANAAFDTIGV